MALNFFLLFFLISNLTILVIRAGDIETLSPIIATKSGQIRGKLVKVTGASGEIYDAYSFTAIPFAEPPVGDRRYQKPVPIKAWNSSLILDATRSPNACIQPGGNQITDFLFSPASGSEDCLYLNIWVPRCALEAATHGSSNHLLSTYVFIHGGAFVGGSASLYNGSTFAALHNVIVASIQYRLGSLGFAYFGTEDVPGNMGMWDQLEALKWVYENIASFGGNNSEITIGGQSAGAASVTFHLLSPYSRKYFQRAIIQSGTAIGAWAVHTAQQATKATDIMFEQVAAKMDQCNKNGKLTANSTTGDKTQCLKTADASFIPRADVSVALAGMGIPFTPVIDGDFLPRDPYEMLRAGDYYKVPLLIGANKDEGSSFLVMSPQAFFLLPTPSNPNKTIDENLNLTHYRSIIDGTFRLFLGGLQPFNELLLDAIELHYWPQTHIGYPRGVEIVDALSQIVGDMALLCPTYNWAQESATSSDNIFTYYFTHRRAGETAPQWMGVMHGAEIPFVFGEPLNPDPSGKHCFTREDRWLSLSLMTYWGNFIKYGNPNGNNNSNNYVTLRNWPTHIGDECPSRIFEINFTKQLYGTGEAVLCGLKARECKFWQRFYQQIIQLVPKQDSQQQMASTEPITTEQAVLTTTEQIMSTTTTVTNQLPNISEIN